MKKYSFLVWFNKGELLSDKNEVGVKASSLCHPCYQVCPYPDYLLFLTEIGSKKIWLRLTIYKLNSHWKL